MNWKTLFLTQAASSAIIPSDILDDIKNTVSNGLPQIPNILSSLPQLASQFLPPQKTNSPSSQATKALKITENSSPTQVQQDSSTSTNQTPTSSANAQTPSSNSEEMSAPNFQVNLKTGLIIAGAVALLLLAVILILYFRRRRFGEKSIQNKSSDEVPSSNSRKFVAYNDTSRSSLSHSEKLDSHFQVRHQSVAISEYSNDDGLEFFGRDRPLSGESLNDRYSNERHGHYPPQSIYTDVRKSTYDDSEYAFDDTIKHHNEDYT